MTLFSYCQILYILWLFGLCRIMSTPPIRNDLFRGHGWNRLILRKRLETNYFANAFGRDLFRESVWKWLSLKPIFEKTYLGAFKLSVVQTLSMSVAIINNYNSYADLTVRWLRRSGPYLWAARGGHQYSGGQQLKILKSLKLFLHLVFYEKNLFLKF